ncbi:MAG: DUF58 domain-containing protein [Geminicoccaceae bacterium]
MIRPTAAAIWLFGGGILISTLILIVDAEFWTVGLGILAISIAMLLADHFCATHPTDLRIEAALPAQLDVGVPRTLAIAIDCDERRRPAQADIIIDAGSLGEPQAWARIEMPRSGPAHAEVELLANRRGMIAHIGLWLRWQGPFGLCWRIHHRRLEEPIPVMPDTSAARQVGIQLTSRSSMIGQRSQRLKGVGSEFEALREHMAGMDSRAIDWKHSARHNKLLVREYQAERNHRIVTAIDCGYLMREPLGRMPRLDHAVRAALALAYAALAAEDRVGLYGFAATPGPYASPQAGLGAFHRLRRLTAELDYQSDETNFTLGLSHLGIRLKQRALVVVLTDFIDTASVDLMVESLGRMARRHVVLFVALSDPALEALAEKRPETVDDITRSVVSDGLRRERRLVIEQLQRRGVHCVDSPPHKLISHLIERYFDIKRLELV